jgi:hypothetical protein
MLYNVFETEQASVDAQEIDYSMFISIHRNPDAYVAQTTAWAMPQQRLDGKWIYPVCEHGIQTHTQEEHNQEWFEQEEAV